MSEPIGHRWSVLIALAALAVAIPGTVVAVREITRKTDAVSERSATNPVLSDLSSELTVSTEPAVSVTAVVSAPPLSTTEVGGGPESVEETTTTALSSQLIESSAEGVRRAWFQLQEAEKAGDIELLLSHLADGTFTIWTVDQCRAGITLPLQQSGPILNIIGPQSIILDYGDSRTVAYEDVWILETGEPSAPETRRIQIKDGGWFYFRNCDHS